jgi:hypothetical protein
MSNTIEMGMMKTIKIQICSSTKYAMNERGPFGTEDAFEDLASTIFGY